MVSESSDNEDDTETASEISEHQESENPNLEPEGNSEILLKGKGLGYYCNGENVYERAVVKFPNIDVFGMMVIIFVPYVHIKFLLIVNT